MFFLRHRELPCLRFEHTHRCLQHPPYPGIMMISRLRAKHTAIPAAPTVTNFSAAGAAISLTSRLIPTITGGWMMYAV